MQIGFLLLLLLFKAVLAVIQHLAHRRDSLRGDLDQIKSGVLSSAHGHLNADHALLLAVGSDQANLTVTDLTVDLQFLRLSTRLSLNIDTNDFNTKLNQTAKFLAAGHKVKASIRFRGREMAHSALGADVLKRFAEALPQASMDKPPVLEGRTMSILLIPKPNKD